MMYNSAKTRWDHMIKNKEAILQEKTEKFYETVKIYLEDMDTLSDTSDSQHV